jgi:adenylate cyclase
MSGLLNHWKRIALTLLPLVFALLHASGLLPLPVLTRLDEIIYDSRLRATMPKVVDERLVILDIDEKSLAEMGRWPWSRNKLAQLVTEVFDRQKAAVMGFDVVFAEPDESSGLKRLKQLATNELRDQPGFGNRLAKLEPQLDYDAAFAQALRGRPVVLGYYFSSDQQSRTSGTLPQPAVTQEAMKGRSVRLTSWNGYGSNIETLAAAAPVAGFFNSITDPDGVVRALPMLGEFKGNYYESLSLAVFRLIAGNPDVEPGFPKDHFLPRSYRALENLTLNKSGMSFSIPVDDRVSALVPFRGKGGPVAGTYQYISVSDVLNQRLAPGSLQGKVVLVGTTAPGLLDLRVTPVGETYPGVEAHANMISGLLDGKLLVRPDYAVGYDVVILLLLGGVLATLPRLSASRTVLVTVVALIVAVSLNSWLYLSAGLVLPLAAALAMTLSGFALNMSFGYFVESRTKRELAKLFGTYVPPELVDVMLKDPENYSMRAQSKELTVLFCDMRGFTNLSERLEPTQLQSLLNSVFNRLSQVISDHHGTIDKYMGDCVMAFWGAPVDQPNHAQLAVQTARALATEVAKINQSHIISGLPPIGVGIGINTGLMAVGDMGSEVRQAYTVIGDAVNLAARLEGLSKVYGTPIVVSEATRNSCSGMVWQELDLVRVKGKENAVSIYCPVCDKAELNENLQDEMKLWTQVLSAYRYQDWESCEVLLFNLQRTSPEKSLYALYAERVASLKLLPNDPQWDGATRFETK